jgi:hypothetical protein
VCLETQTPLDLASCRQHCADLPPTQDLDDLAAFLATYHDENIVDRKVDYDSRESIMPFVTFEMGMKGGRGVS